PPQHLRRRAGAPPALAPGDRAQASSPGGAAGRRRGLRRVGGDGPARGPERRAPPHRPGAARAAAHDRARLAPRLRHPARQEGLPAHERELRPLPAARARAAGPRQEARHGRAGARRAHALAGERAPGRGAGGLPVGGVIPVAAVAAVIDIGSNSVLLLTVAVDRGRARVLDQALAVTRLGTGLRPGGRLDADALALTEAHGADLDGAHAAVGAVLAASELPARARAAGARLAASGGTATALAALDLRLGAYVPRRVHGHVLARTALAGLTARLARMTAAERAALPGLDPGRGAILPAGALVLERVADALGADRIVVSDHGVRHAYLRAALARDGLPADFREL